MMLSTENPKSLESNDRKMRDLARRQAARDEQVRNLPQGDRVWT